MGESMLFNFGRIMSERLLQLCSENFIKNTNESVPFFQTKVLQRSEERLLLCIQRTLCFVVVVCYVIPETEYEWIV